MSACQNQGHVRINKTKRLLAYVDIHVPQISSIFFFLKLRIPDGCWERVVSSSQPRDGRMDKGRPRLQRSASARGALQRSNSLILFFKPWASGQDDEEYLSSEDEVVAPPVSPAISQEDAKVGFFCCQNRACCRAAVLLVPS